MTNPAQTMRMLIAYAVIIPLAILVGYLLSDPLNYGTLGFLGVILIILVSPIFIKWHYPILIFGLACPAICFFLPGRPPLAQIVVIISLGMAVFERVLNSEKRFLTTPAMTWPLLFIAAVVYLTAKLTGGIHLHASGGGEGGGKKYIEVFIGIATYFALASRAIPRNHWKGYLMLFLLPSLLGLFSDLFSVLPGPLKYISLVFPPKAGSSEEIVLGQTRMVSLSFAVGTILVYMLARYGLRGIFLHRHPGRAIIFLGSFAASMLGGFRNAFAGTMLTMGLMFLLERLHRTKLLPIMAMLGVLGVVTLACVSDQLPYTFQRSMSFLPFKWKTDVTMDAEGSSEWRHRIWRATWPKVPEHLLLGKGYTLTAEDMQMIGSGEFARFGASHVDASDEALAVSNDYHSGPLSTLMGFGVWGGIGMVWLMGATLFVLYRNYRYGDAELRVVNVFMLATCISSIVSFFFVFGAFNGDVGNFAKMAGISLAFNGGLAKRPARVTTLQRIKPLPEAGEPQAAGG